MALFKGQTVAHWETGASWIDMEILDLSDDPLHSHAFTHTHTHRHMHAVTQILGNGPIVYILNRLRLQLGMTRPEQVFM